MELHHVHPHLPQVERHELAANHAGRGLLAHAEVGVEAGEVGVAEAVVILKGEKLTEFREIWQIVHKISVNISFKSV